MCGWLHVAAIETVVSDTDIFTMSDGLPQPSEPERAEFRRV